MISPALVQRAIAQMQKGAEHFAYFFDNLSSAEWIESLVGQGLFSAPPPQEIRDGNVLAPIWPPSQYLARVAALAPDDVLAVIAQINTNNERIHADFIDAAVAMPVAQAAAVGEIEIEYLAARDRLYFGLPNAFAELVAYLASDSEWDVAVELAWELLRARDGAHTPDSTGGTRLLRDWDFGEAAEQIGERLLPHLPKQVIVLFTRLLVEALSLQHEAPDDLSSIWLSRIGAGERTRPAAILADVLHQSATQARADGLLSLDEIAEVLRANNWYLCQRILWLTLSEEQHPTGDTLRDGILDRQELLRSEPSAEYEAAVRKHFGALHAEDQREFRAWIAEGPAGSDIARWREWTQEQDGEDRSAEFVDVWKLKRLTLIEGSLAGSFRDEYERLVAKYGQRELAPRYEVRSWVGPTSPLTLDELTELPDRELLNFLDTWEPSGEWAAPSIDGLARAITELTLAEPLRLSRLAASFAGVAPSFAAALMSGLSRALRENATLEWEPVLDLCRSLIARSAKELEEVGSDPWFTGRGLRVEIAAFLSAAFESTEAPMPQSHRAEAFSLIRDLANDEDPNDSGRVEGSDPLTLALNSVRSQALNAAVRYGLWIRRAAEGGGDTGLAAADFDAMPELRELLEVHAVTDQDPSLAVKSVYGQWFPWLVLLDSAWASSHLAEIFPTDPAAIDYWWAAWGAYVAMNPVYDNVAAVLSDVYLHATSLVNVQEPAPRWFGSVETPHERLADHLAILLWRGKAPEELLDEFFARADANLRKHFLEVLGRGLHEVDSDLDDATRDRVCAFFDSRITAARGKSSDERRELTALGWWLESERLQNSWKLGRLHDTLSLGVLVEPEWEVYKFLAAASAGEPLAAVQNLTEILRIADRPPWSILGNHEAIQRVLESALEASDDEAKRVAVDLIHQLGSMGFREFRGLLTQGS